MKLDVNHVQTRRRSGYSPYTAETIRMDHCDPPCRVPALHSGQAILPSISYLAPLQLHPGAALPARPYADIDRDHIDILPGVTAVGQARVQLEAILQGALCLFKVGQSRTDTLLVCAANDDLAAGAWSRNDVWWWCGLGCRSVCCMLSQGTTFGFAEPYSM